MTPPCQAMLSNNSTPASFTPLLYCLQIVNAQIYGLKSQPELNGASGKVVRWDEDKGRYEVNVPSHNKSLSLQPANVVLPTGVVCRCLLCFDHFFP